MTGTVKLEGDGPPGPSDRSSWPIWKGRFGHASNAQAEDDGTFELHGVAAGEVCRNRRHITGRSVREVDPVRAAGCHAHDARLDLWRERHPRYPAFAATHAEVSGTVRNKDGAAMTGVEVTLWPKRGAAEKRLERPRRSSTDQNGDFRIAGLAPGEYYVDRVGRARARPDATIIEFLQRFASQATAVAAGGRRASDRPAKIDFSRGRGRRGSQASLGSFRRLRRLPAESD